MRKRVYSSNAWSYVQLGDSFGLGDAVRRIANAGYDGFDFLYGVEAYPRAGHDLKLNDIVDLKNIAQGNGAKISAVVLVSFELNNIEDCMRQLEEGAVLANALGAGRINLLPRKVGITQSEGFKRLEHVWAAKGEEILDMGLVVSAENHIWFDGPDEDIFLIRKTEDFIRICNMLDGQIRIKFDPAWLLKAGDDLMPAFTRCLPFTDILDAKDFADGKFVTPGTGLVDFKGLARMMSEAGRTIDIAVEVEEHHFYEPSPLDAEAIDNLNRSALHYYKKIFEGAAMK